MIFILLCIVENFINKAMTNINSSKVISSQVPDQFFVWGWILKGVFSNYVQ